MVIGKPDSGNSGCGVFIYNGQFVMTDGTITENQVVKDGGNGSGVTDYGVSFSFEMTCSTISGNIATGEGEFYHAGTKLTVGGDAVIDTNSTCIPNEEIIRNITVQNDFTGHLCNITASNIAHGTKLVEFPSEVGESAFEGKLTLAPPLIDKN